ncbi:hypothetical protein LSAT2_008652 [Lamellibrachia satsuma]|nr:hypothetical protein LSAT2_008652 [Lamellibrachia satsuma]
MCSVCPQEVPMEAVPVQMVAQRIQEAVTYHDVLSIFYGDRLTNDIIDNILATKWHGRSKARPRPRIGGLSDTMSFSPHETTYQGRRPHLNYSHVCAGCTPIGPSFVPHRIVGRTRVKNRTDSKRRVRRHKKKRGRRKGRGRKRKRNRKGKKRTRKRKGPKRKRKGRRRRKAFTKALVHAKEMETETQCNAPKPRLVCMRDVNSVANKEYFPRCTVVHQCSPSVGCCNASSECSPVNTTSITRHFFAMAYKTPDHKVTWNQVETFTFVNHTACDCRQVNQPPRKRNPPPASFSVPGTCSLRLRARDMQSTSPCPGHAVYVSVPGTCSLRLRARDMQSTSPCPGHAVYVSVPGTCRLRLRARDMQSTSPCPGHAVYGSVPGTCSLRLRARDMPSTSPCPGHAVYVSVPGTCSLRLRARDMQSTSPCPGHAVYVSVPGTCRSGSTAAVYLATWLSGARYGDDLLMRR